MACCKCSVCRDDREIERVKREGSPEELLRLIDTLQERLANAGLDVNYLRAIMDSSWPSARQHAERILKLCDEREKRKP